MAYEEKIKIISQAIRMLVGGGGFLLMMVAKFNGNDLEILWIIIPAIILAIDPKEIPAIIKEWIKK